MYGLNFLFALVSATSVFSYYFIGNSLGWTERSVLDIQTSYWNSFQAVIWSFAILMMRSRDASIWSILPILPTTVLYGYIGEQKDFQFSLNPGAKLSPTAIATLSLLGIGFLGYIISVLYTRGLYYTALSNVYFFIPLLLFVTWILTWLSFQKVVTTTTQEIPAYFDQYYHKYEYGGLETDTTTSTTTIHLHHWMIALIGMLSTHDGRVLSEILSGVFWGVFCQELGAYGIATAVDIKKTTQTSVTPKLLK